MLSAQLPGCLTVAVGNAADPAFAVGHPASSFGSPLYISCRHRSMRCTNSPARSSRYSSYLTDPARSPHWPAACSTPVRKETKENVNEHGSPGHNESDVEVQEWNSR